MKKTCMGGFCSKRDQCPHSEPVPGVEPAQRLCLPGQDGIRLVESTPFRKITVDVFHRGEKRLEEPA